MLRLSVRCVVECRWLSESRAVARCVCAHVRGGAFGGGCDFVVRREGDGPRRRRKAKGSGGAEDGGHSGHTGRERDEQQQSQRHQPTATERGEECGGGGDAGRSTRRSGAQRPQLIGVRRGTIAALAPCSSRSNSDNNQTCLIDGCYPFHGFDFRTVRQRKTHERRASRPIGRPHAAHSASPPSRSFPHRGRSELKPSGLHDRSANSVGGAVAADSAAQVSAGATMRSRGRNRTESVPSGGCFLFPRPPFRPSWRL